MKQAFEKAKVDTSKSSLAVIAYEALKKAHMSPAVAVDGFVDVVLAGGGLLMQLLGFSRADINAHALQYLRDRADEMAGKPAKATDAVSQGRPEIQTVRDRSAGGAVGLSHVDLDSQAGHDQPDRPINVKPHKRAAPGAKLSRAAAMAVARSIYDREIGSGKTKIGMLTKFDILNIKRRGLIDSTIAEGLLDREWPDEQRTTVRELFTEAEVEACFARAHRVLDSMGIAHGAAA